MSPQDENQVDMPMSENDKSVTDKETVECGELSKDVEFKPIPPSLQCCIFCEGIATTPEGKTVLVGIFDKLKTGSIPQLNIFTRWTNGQGKHRSSIRILDPDLNVLISPMSESEFELPYRTSIATANITIGNFNFTKPGVYWIEVILNGETYTAFPIPVY